MDSKTPASLSDRGPQMRSKTIRRFFYDLGITQMFTRIENAGRQRDGRFFAPSRVSASTKATTRTRSSSYSDADAFVAYYNDERLHMGASGSSLRPRSTTGERMGSSRRARQA
jgi:transposase InsO family protein